MVSVALVCLLVSNITQEVINRLHWNFMERSQVYLSSMIASI